MGTKIILILGLVSTVRLFAQSGCTDPQAINFDASAQFNDGSCQYAPSTHTPTLLQNLSPVLKENSGMVVWNNHIWMLNDGGSLPMLLKLDLNGNIVDSLVLTSATNVDWEALTQSPTHLYIGDFGNNAGNRTDLAIYEVSKQDVLASTTHEVSSIKRTFNYADQAQFNGPTNGHAFDCEAFYCDQDSLVMLTKNWNNLYTKRYRFPTLWQDTLSISPIDSLFVDGLITDVSIDAPSKRVVALGYKNNGSNFYTSFVYVFFDFLGSNIFSGNKRRIELGNMLSLGQTEGIAWQDSVHAFISSEQIASIITIPPKLFSTDFTTYFNGNAGLNETTQSVTVHPNPGNGFIYIPIEFTGETVRIYSAMGTFIIEKPVENEGRIDLGGLAVGTYVIKAGAFHARFIKID